MKLSEAIHIFETINSDEYTDEEKCQAIYDVMLMPTHNSISKSAMLGVISYLLEMVVEWQDAGEEADK